jgi:hypothetical protein
MVHEVLVSKRHRARADETEVGHETEGLVLPCLSEHEVVRAFVDERAESVCDGCTEEEDGQENEPGASVAELEGNRPLSGHEQNDPGGGPGVGAEELAHLGVQLEDRPLSPDVPEGLLRRGRGACRRIGAVEAGVLVGVCARSRAIRYEARSCCRARRGDPVRGPFDGGSHARRS